MPADTLRVTHVAASVDTQSASYRLSRALARSGIDSTMLVQGNAGGLEGVISCHGPVSGGGTLLDLGRRVARRIRRGRSGGAASSLGPFSGRDLGLAVLDHPAVYDADIIHLHWIVGFLSLAAIGQLGRLGKPIVWTCHDSWPFTGGCHVRYDCEEYKTDCYPCPYLKRGSGTARRFLVKKNEILNDIDLTMVGPSRWMASCISGSIFRGKSVEVLPNCVDGTVFRPDDRGILRARLGIPKGRTVIGCSALTSSVAYKGIEYLRQALLRLSRERPDLASFVELLVVGADSLDLGLPFKVRFFGRLTNEFLLSACFAACDVIAVPSLEESFSNVVLEGLSCGVPVLAFAIGGIPDMVVHRQNGYLARPKDAGDLFQGLVWLMENPDPAGLSAAARQAVTGQFTFDKVADRAIAMYRRLIDGARTVSK